MARNALAGRSSVRGLRGSSSSRSGGGIKGGYGSGGNRNAAATAARNFFPTGAALGDDTDPIVTLVTQGDDDPATNEVQSITMLSSADGGTWDLTFDGDTAADLDWDISAADLQTELRALPSVGGANVTVASPSAGLYVVEFMGALAATDVALMTADGSNLTQTRR